MMTKSERKYIFGIWREVISMDSVKENFAWNQFK